jgi:uncharacterized membrane protein HdeD (DUF308 family)
MYGNDQNLSSSLWRFYSGTWWVLLLRGLALVALGILFIARPLATVAGLLSVLAIFWIITGVLAIVRSIRIREHFRGWGWMLASGFLGIVAGAIILIFPLPSALVSLVLTVSAVCILALVDGVTSIAIGARLSKPFPGAWALILEGVIMVVVVVLAFVFPLAAQSVVVWMLGLAAIAGGIFGSVLSVRMLTSGRKLLGS